MKSKHLIIFSVLLLALVNIQANIIVFVGDKTGFLNETGATSIGSYPNLGAVSNFSRLGEAVFSLAPGGSSLHFGTGAANDWTEAISGGTLAISGPESFNIDFDNPTFAVGFDIVERNSNNSSTFQVTLKNDGNLVGSFNYSTPSSITPLFVGASSSQAFNRVEILETVGSSVDEYFGEILTSSSSSVPEPSSLLLLIFTGLGFFFFSKKHK